MEDSHDQPTPSTDDNRRDFIQKAACIGLGGLATLGPVAAGITVLLNPIFEKSGTGTLVRITTLENLPTGAAPQLFKVVAERKDGWTRHPQLPIGSLFLHRSGEGTAPEDFAAFNASCPHVGCAVDFVSEQDCFVCPCHDSQFAKTGEVSNAGSPARRGLDSLRVEVKGDEVWVEFQNFKADVAEKIPV